jgi:NAD(P)-dependent dehydrogenase (short-subunit alcohol dehydrogenase family)
MNVIVTGASRGIGYEIVKTFAGIPGNRIVALARNRNNLERLKKICETMPSGMGVEIVQTDLLNTDRLFSELIPHISQLLSKLDILINNAGYLINKPFEEIQPEELDNIIGINLKAPFLLIQALIDLMKKAGSSHVVNISSMGGINGSVKFSGLSAYSAAKGGLGILTECLAEEYRDSSISFNCLALGSVQTEMLEEAFPGYRAPLTAHEMARFIVDFAINGHKFFNGKILPVSISTP